MNVNKKKVLLLMNCMLLWHGSDFRVMYCAGLFQEKKPKDIASKFQTFKMEITFGK